MARVEDERQHQHSPRPPGHGDPAPREKGSAPAHPPVAPTPTEPDRGRDESRDRDRRDRRSFLHRPITWIVAGVLLIGIIGGVIYWLYSSNYESTDDAFVDGNIVPVSSKVSGTIQRLLVDDNQDVAAGQLLIQIDPRDIQASLDRATATLDAARSKLEAAKTNVELSKTNTAATLAETQAGVEQAKAGVTSAQAMLESAQADVGSAESEANRRQADLKRLEALDPRAVSQQQIDAARSAADAAQSALVATRKRVTQAQSSIGEAQAKLAAAQAVERAAETGPQQVATAEAQAKTAQADVEQADAAVRELQLQLSYTSICAPVAGRVTRRTAQIGQNAQIGQTLLAVVGPDLWVTANFKETQLTHMHAGQDVRIEVDAYPDRKFRGRVDSIQAGTGARFSLLPPENATGNFVKVVQRVPVKIVFSSDEPVRELLGPGMSVVPRVDISGDKDAAPLPISPPATTQPIRTAEAPR